MEINKSIDYKKFATITGNRVLNQRKIEKIVADIEGGFNMLPYCPIVVSENKGKYLIIDGQHRYKVSVATNNPIYYVVCEGLNLKQIAVLNSRSDKWKTTDFLNCYINLGIKDYEILRDMTEEFSMPISTVADLLMLNHCKAKTTEAFQNGEFKCLHTEETKILLTAVTQLFGKYVFSKDKNLISAVQQIMKKDKCDLEKLKLKLKSAPMMMDKQGNVKNYIYNIERVYNFKTQTREYIS